MTYEAFYYKSGSRYAILDPQQSRQRKVFHRLTKSDKTACNGTNVNADEVRDYLPESDSTLRPCVRCFGYRRSPVLGAETPRSSETTPEATARPLAARAATA